jgi:hypothetical protein
MGNRRGIARRRTYRYDRRSDEKLQAKDFRSKSGPWMGAGLMTPDLIREPIQVSPRFRSAIEARFLELERNAGQDERALATLTHSDHRRRHRLLVEKQLEKAFRLREMLAQVCARAAAGRRERAAGGNLA